MYHLNSGEPMPANPPFQTIRAEAVDPLLYDDGAAGLPRLTRKAFLVAISRVFDLAEGRPLGHAQRVAYIGTELGRDAGLGHTDAETVFFACLLHDAGAAVCPPHPLRDAAPGASFVAGAASTAEILASVPSGSWADAVRAIRRHAEEGARIARKLGLPDAVAEAIYRHHDCWDGSGGDGGSSASLATRMVAAADRLESLIALDPSPLTVRRRIGRLITEMAGAEVAPDVAAHMLAVAARDDFWLGLYDNDLAAGLMVYGQGPVLTPHELVECAAAVSDVVDARSGRDGSRGRRVAELAARVALAAGLSQRRADLVRLAALLQDIGAFGIPIALLHKPDILSIDEMAVMQQHPTFARDILSEAPGLGAAAWWVACHHERVDGKGYPGMLQGDEVPVEAQLIGMAEAFDALTSDRPYRRAMLPADAIQVMRGLAGARFAPALLARFESVVSL